MKYLYLLIPTLLFLTVSVPTADARVSGSCTVGPSTEIVPGEHVTWKVEPSGGNAIYEYEWTGSEGLSGHERSAGISYRTEGRKWAEVTITAGNEQARISCGQIDVSYPPLRGACTVSTTASNERIRTQWGTEIAGGNGVYTYSWSGSEGLSSSGASVSKTYITGGRKDARVRISSNGESITLNCDTTIPDVRDLSEDSVTFGCDVQGGTYATERPLTWYGLYSADDRNWEAGFSYRWDLDQSREYGKRVRVEYEDAGYKVGTLTTSEELQRDLLITRSRCSAYITDEDTLSDTDVDYERIERTEDDGEDVDIFARNVARYRDRVQRDPGEGCFIATAAYGSILEPEVETLRTFRDEKMQTTPVGRALVNAYYFTSPSLASVIRKSDVLRLSARIALSPIVAVVKMLN